MPNCPGCGRQVQAEWRFCRTCGQALTEDAPSQTTSVGDLVAPEFLARLIRLDEMSGLLTKTLQIDEGQAALLFLGGRHDVTLGPGSHSISALSSRGRDASVVLFRTADVTMPLSVAGLFTSDPLPVTLDSHLVVKVERPLLLWTNLAAGADSYTTQNLAGSLYPLAEEGCEGFFKTRSIRDVAADSSLSRDLQLALSSQLDQPLSRWGIRLVSLQGVSISCQAWDEVTKSRTDYFVTASEERAGLEGRKRLFDVYRESELQTMAQETAEVAAVEKRVSLWARLRQALLSNARGELESQAEMEDLVRRGDKDRLLKDDERDALVRAMGEAKEDHHKARIFALRRVESEGEHELQKLDLWHRYGLEQERLTMEISAAREEMERRWDMELRRLGAEIEQQRRRENFRREQETEELALRSRSQLGQARTAASIADLEREQDRADMEMGLDILDRLKREQIDREWQQRLHALEEAERQLNMELDAEAQRMEMRLREARKEHGHEITRIQTLSTAGIETLIAVSGPEQSQLLAQLARTRAFAGCTPEKILAMQAADSPQVADALKEILTATAATGQLEQYERLVTQLKDSGQTSREDYQHNLTVMHQMFDKALDSVKETAVAFSAVSAPVAPPQPDLRSHTSPDGIVTLFFSDIEGSTAMTERLGDQRAQQVLRDHNEIVRLQVANHDGFEVKSMGDGFMLAFSSARNGIRCAIDVQRNLAVYSNEHPEQPLRVRIGIHTGEAIKESEDFFGRNVIMAARISSKAQGGQILVSSLVKELTESSGDIRFDDGREVELKGLAGLTRVHGVEWE